MLLFLVSALCLPTFHCTSYVDWRALVSYVCVVPTFYCTSCVYWHARVSYFYVAPAFHCTLCTDMHSFLISALGLPSTDGSLDQNEEEAAGDVQTGRLCGHVHCKRDDGSAWYAIRWRDHPYPHVRAPTAGEGFQKSSCHVRMV